MRRFPVLGLALILLLSGCSTVAEHSETPNPSPIPDAAVTEAVRPDPPVWAEQTDAAVFPDDGQSAPVFSTAYSLPRIDNADASPAYQRINDFYAAALGDLTEAADERFAQARKAAEHAAAQGEAFQPFADGESYEITMATARQVSILRSHYSNSGGPYPLLYPIGDTFDLTTGQRLSFADLFTIPADQAAARVLEAVLDSNAAGSYGDTVLPEDVLMAVWSPEQFYLTEDSIVLYFPDSELPHAVGTPTFAVPYTQLEDILQTWE